MRTNKIRPGLDGLVRIAETFNMSLDYHAIENVAQRPLHALDNVLRARLTALAKPDGTDGDDRIGVIDTFTTKTRVRDALTDAS